MKYLKKIKYSLVFKRLNKLNSDGTALIQIKAYQNAKSRYFSTEVWIEPKYWDKRNKRVKHTHPTQFIYNQRIQEQMAAMEAYEIQQINRLGAFPLDRLDEYTSNNRELATFTDFFKSELQSEGLTIGTFKAKRTTFNKLVDFRKNVYFRDLTYQFITGFDRFLKRQNLGANTLVKHHKIMKQMIREAEKLGYCDANNNPYLHFKMKGEEPNRVYLTEEELDKMERIKFTQDDKHLERIRDFFLFACWTGLRFSDVNALVSRQFSKTKNGLVLSLQAEKTKKHLQLPLFLLFKNGKTGVSKPEAIAQKYIHLSPVFEKAGIPKESTPIFGGISNQYFNRLLKLVAAKAGIDKRIASHSARRSFATILSRKVKMPVLQKLLQHSTLSMVQIYVQLGNGEIEDELMKIKW